MNFSTPKQKSHKPVIALPKELSMWIRRETFEVWSVYHRDQRKEK